MLKGVYVKSASRNFIAMAFCAIYFSKKYNQINIINYFLKSKNKISMVIYDIECFLLKLLQETHLFFYFQNLVYREKKIKQAL